MVTVSHLVKHLIKDKPFLQEALANKLISYGNLAEQLTPKIEEELGKKVKHSAVVMALRRYADELEKDHKSVTSFNYKSEIIMKTNICDICVSKTPSLMTKLKKLYEMVDFDKGDTLDVILGNFEVSIVTNEKYKAKFLKFLKGDKILTKESNLVALTMRFSDDFIHTPGVIFTAIRKLAWENINIFEIISTLSELTLILREKDSMKAYEALGSLVEK
jgi:aspartokinase